MLDAAVCSILDMTTFVMSVCGARCRSRRNTHKFMEPSPGKSCRLNRSMQHHLVEIFSLKVVFMTVRRQVKLSENQRNDMWRRWKAGQSLHEIGRVFGKDHVSIQFMLAQHGGIAPASRRRSSLMLTLAERENISRGIACGSSIREIAKGLQRAVSKVSREVARHGGRPQYRATDADQKAWESALRPKRCLQSD
jgi:hypothetical protein